MRAGLAGERPSSALSGTFSHCVPQREKGLVVRFRSLYRVHIDCVMAGLDPAIFFGGREKDRRVKPGDDAFWGDDALRGDDEFGVMTRVGRAAAN